MFGVHRRTIQRWIGRTEPTDRPGGPRSNRRRVVTDAYRDAVIAMRQAHPHDGPKRIAHEVRAQFPAANAATVWRILHAAGLTRRPEKKRPRQAIPVGRHRVQMDIQELPAIRGQRKRDYKISLIHLRTRMKDSEIHPRRSRRQVAATLHRALDRALPFHLVVTDTAMTFTYGLRGPSGAENDV